MMLYRLSCSLLLCLFLVACAKGQGISLGGYGHEQASPEYFTVCHGFSCSGRTLVLLTEKEWLSVLAPFNRKAKTAESERTKIAQAIARMEQRVVDATDMTPDRAEAETFGGKEHQMDCIDEAINTSLYLRLLDQEGVLRFHEFHDPVHRGYFVDGVYPHNAGAVQEKETGTIYVVDSYYEDNGKPPAILPLDIWIKNWRPPEPEKVR